MVFVNKGLALLFIFAALGLGGFIGFGIGVATSEAGRELIANLDMTERPADMSRLKTVDQAGFSFQHPGNWKPITDEPGFDPAHYMSIETPGGSFVEVTFEEQDAAGDEATSVNLDAKLDQYGTYLNGPQYSEFKSYGNLSGEGMLVKGRSMGYAVTLRVFSTSKNGRSLVILEHVYDSDVHMVQPGFALVEQSFVFK